MFLGLLWRNCNYLIAQRRRSGLLVPCLRIVLYMVLLLVSLGTWAIRLNKIVMLGLSLCRISSQRSLLPRISLLMCCWLMRRSGVNPLHILLLLLVQNLVHSLLDCLGATLIKSILGRLRRDTRPLYSLESLWLRLLIQCRRAAVRDFVWPIFLDVWWIRSS